jgi:hypothetical protein
VDSAAALEHKWDLVDAVGRSPLLGPATLPQGIDLAGVEQMLLRAEALPAADRERLIAAARELADVYRAFRASEAGS